MLICFVLKTVKRSGLLLLFIESLLLGNLPHFYRKSHIPPFSNFWRLHSPLNNRKGFHYRPPLNYAFSRAGMQLSGGRGGPPCSFLKIEEKRPNFEKNALLLCINALNSHLKCRFRSILEIKAPKLIPVRSSFCMSYMKHLLKCPYSKQPSLPLKIPGCGPTMKNPVQWGLR